MWEHFVLNELHAHLQTRKIQYWRDKRGHEVDFVILLRGQQPFAIECKWSASDFDASGMKAFRRQYGQGENFVVSKDVDRSYRKSYAQIEATFVNLEALVRNIDPVFKL